MTQANKFEDQNATFTSLEIEMTQINKFEDLNDRFTGLRTRIA